jgi:hypothetical protein
MDIKEIRSTLVVLFPVDEYDYKALTNDAFSLRLSSDFGCTRTENPFPLPIPMLAFGAGKITIDEKIRIIDRIVIEERKITITVGGSSTEARRALQELLTLISLFETRHDSRALIPIIEVDESVCIAKLDFPFTKLLSNSAGAKVVEAVHKIPEMAPEGYRVQIYPSSVRYRIAYRGENALLIRHHITLNEKALVIEIREGTDPEEQIFFVTAPIKSDELLSLLMSFEEQLV